MLDKSTSNAIDHVYRVGDVIGSIYKVLKIMEDGMGIVYIVRGENSDSPVVLKTPKWQSDSTVRENFRIEAETWVRISGHLNVVNAYWVDELSGQLFVCAEFFQPDKLGRVTLRDHLNSGPLQPWAIAAWSVNFCRGLEHACSEGLVAHRDIKPENLLVRGYFSKITDFGISRAMVARTTSPQMDQTKLGVWQTVGGNISGTPPYMAPEQWLGAKQDVRTDFYAFGVTFYEMCYGRRPFPGPNYGQQHLLLEPENP